MNNKERYKQAFSALHPSVQLSLEAEKMVKIQKKHKINMAIAAAIICIVIIGGSGTAYAADIGGIREKISMWLYGAQTEVNVTDNGDGGYTFIYEHDGEIKEMGAGGISIDENGNETWLSADELAEDMSQHADVVADETGKVWVYYYDQQIDITDRFDQDGICRIMLSHDGATSYLKVIRKEDGSYHYSQSGEPEDDKELYTKATDYGNQ